MLLGHGESVLRSAYAVAEGGEATGHPNGPGVLYVTNLRVVFEAAVGRGRIGRRSGQETQVQLDASLHEVHNVGVRRGRIGRPRLLLDLARSRFTFDVLEPEAWTTTIAQAKRSLPPASAYGGGIVHTIERQVVKVRCRFCGTLGNEVEGRCPSCGAPL